MDYGNGIPELVQRYKAFQMYHGKSSEVISELVVNAQRVDTDAKHKIEQLATELHLSRLSCENALKAKQEVQQELDQLKANMASVMGRSGNVQNSNPYVVVLIDGDGLLFRDHFVRRGVEGGKSAAHALKAAILQKCHGLNREIEVITKVCANLPGLAQAMRREGILEREGDLREFSVGFSQAVASFDFVDVGYGSSGLKIKQSAIWHLKNDSCLQVILGISHDASYAPFVEGLTKVEYLRHRITILEGAQTVPELASSGANLVNLNDMIFRSQKFTGDLLPKEDFVLELLSSPFSSPQPASLSTFSRPSSTPAVDPGSYARAIKKSATPPPKLALPKLSQPKASSKPSQLNKPVQPPWNPGPRGLDPPLRVNSEALERIKKRKDHDKLCNNHYLRGPCSKGDECVFEHKYKPTAEEIVAIAFLTRQNPCTSGQNCEVENCIYGHHCPTVRDGACSHAYCKFGVKDHPPGTKLRKASQGYDDY